MGGWILVRSKYLNQIDRQKKAIFAICLCLAIIAGGLLMVALRSEELENQKGKIILFPIGNIEGWVLDALEKELGKKFSSKVERREAIKVLAETFSRVRGQYSSSQILNRLRGSVTLGRQDKLLGITDVDLYTECLNFVFGEAELRGQLAVISLARLHQSFYSLQENRAIFLERTKKEAVHELGHVFGLAHCPDPECVMHFSNSLLDTDRKRVEFCPRCRELLEKLVR
jgi:archaemetzincin